MLGIVAVGTVGVVTSQGVPKIFRAPMYRAHYAVVFAIGQLSCLLGWGECWLYGVVISCKKLQIVLCWWRVVSIIYLIGLLYNYCCYCC